MGTEPFIVRWHQKDGKSVVAACDSDILGKVFEEDGKVLDLGSKFFDGEPASRERLGFTLKTAYIGNLVGKETVKVAEDLGIVDSTSVMTVEGVPHAQVLNVPNDG